jgi:hypothetical protein
VFTVAPHMHLVGTSYRAWIEHADGSLGPCLIGVPEWDFDWQLFYRFDVDAGEAPVLRADDKIFVECTYDNTLDNPGVVRALSEQGLTEPVDVMFGSSSLDEMCGLVIGSVEQAPFR